jgi:hypothetical protein
MKTHVVIDMTYHEDEGNQVFVGTEEECYNWIEGQGGFGFEVKPMTKEELKVYNSDVSIASNGHKYHNIPKELDVETWDKMNVADRLRYKGLL